MTTPIPRTDQNDLTDELGRSLEAAILWIDNGDYDASLAWLEQARKALKKWQAPSPP